MNRICKKIYKFSYFRKNIEKHFFSISYEFSNKLCQNPNTYFINLVCILNLFYVSYLYKALVFFPKSRMKSIIFYYQIDISLNLFTIMIKMLKPYFCCYCLSILLK